MIRMPLSFSTIVDSQKDQSMPIKITVSNISSTSLMSIKSLCVLTTKSSPLHQTNNRSINQAFDRPKDVQTKHYLLNDCLLQPIAKSQSIDPLVHLSSKTFEIPVDANSLSPTNVLIACQYVIFPAKLPSRL